ncbi:ABC transporter permease subunit [Paenibacillus sp. LMG 31458]|uniref:ABC transporter permease subunit n=1 Tax=Paenibacillus phytorum TaxID=2654977 RepID=A0ABX1Y4Q8_9BACL|nr:ABC transporter permease subunit [Paenibacillus phytorum]NOU75746.1 ABC transporter permease subunit [Paenibacillus phytorum]
MQNIIKVEKHAELLKPAYKKEQSFRRQIVNKYQLLLLLLPALIYILIFHYVPLYGIQIAFKQYLSVKGIMGSPWVGFRNFETFFHSDSFMLVIKNTIGITLYSLVAGFPLPILLAILLHNLPGVAFRKTVQLIVYAPHFLSVVVIVGMLNVMLQPDYGVVNNLLKIIGLNPVFFMAKAEYFKSIFVWSGIWQNMGFSSVIYLAALASVDPTLYEAAKVDGATRLQRMLYIDLPSIMPTAVILLILHSGQLLNVGFEKVYLMQNAVNLSTSEVISTYVYRVGILKGTFEFGAAVGLFNSLVSAFILIMVNQLVKKLNSTSLF